MKRSVDNQRRLAHMGVVNLHELQEQYLALEVARLVREADQATVDAQKKRRVEEIVTALTPAAIVVTASVALAAVLAVTTPVDIVKLFTTASTSALLGLVTMVLGLFSVSPSSLITFDNLKTVVIPILGLIVADAAVNRTLSAATAITLPNLLIAAVFVVITALTKFWAGFWIYAITVGGSLVTFWVATRLAPLGLRDELSFDPVLRPVLRRIFEPVANRIGASGHWIRKAVHRPRRHRPASRPPQATAVHDSGLRRSLSIVLGTLSGLLAAAVLLAGMSRRVGAVEGALLASATAPFGLWLLVRQWRSIWLGAALTAVGIGFISYGDGRGLITFLLAGFGALLVLLLPWVIVRSVGWGFEGKLTKPGARRGTWRTIRWMPLVIITTVALVELTLNAVPETKYLTTALSTAGVVSLIAFVGWVAWVVIAANFAAKVLFLTLFGWIIGAVFLYGSDPLALLAALVMAFLARQLIPTGASERAANVPTQAALS